MWSKFDKIGRQRKRKKMKKSFKRKDIALKQKFITPIIFSIIATMLNLTLMNHIEQQKRNKNENNKNGISKRTKRNVKRTQKRNII